MDPTWSELRRCVPATRWHWLLTTLPAARHWRCSRYGAILTSAASNPPAKLIPPVGVATVPAGSATVPVASTRAAVGVDTVAFGLVVLVGAPRNEYGGLCAVAPSEIVPVDPAPTPWPWSMPVPPHVTASSPRPSGLSRSTNASSLPAPKLLVSPASRTVPAGATATSP